MAMLGVTRRVLGNRRRTADVLVTFVAGLIIGGPALFTRDGFMVDFTNHLWLVWVQEHAISHHILPTYFVSAPAVGVFYPIYLFYGGTLYALTGALAAALGGHAIAAYVLVCLAAIWAAYGGAVWLARQLGAGSWVAHAPALTFVGSAYYVTNLYGRGAWPEFVATSMLPLLLAAGVSVLRSPPGLWARVLLVVSVTVFAGSHNITLLLGGIALAVLALGLLGALGVSWLELRCVAIAAGLVLLGLCLDAWFLLPDVLRASDTHASTLPTYPWQATAGFNTAKALFWPLRYVPSSSTTPALFVQAPDWFIVAAAVVAALGWRGWGPRLRRSAVVLVALSVLTAGMILWASFYNALPKVIQEVQFPYRLNTYLVLFVSGVVLVAVLGLECMSSRRRRLISRGALGIAGAATATLCVWQLWVPRVRTDVSYSDRANALRSIHATPRTWYDSLTYFDTSARVVPARGSVIIDPRTITSDHVTVTEPAPPGEIPLAISTGAGPYAVRIGGSVRRVGRTIDGYTTVRRLRASRSGPISVTLAPAGGLIVVSRIVTVIALATCLVMLVLALVARRRPPRRSDRGRPAVGGGAGAGSASRSALPASGSGSGPRPAPPARPESSR